MSPPKLGGGIPQARKNLENIPCLNWEFRFPNEPGTHSDLLSTDAEWAKEANSCPTSPRTGDEMGGNEETESKTRETQT